MLEYSTKLLYEGQHNYISMYVPYDARIEYRTIILRVNPYIHNTE